MIDSLAKPYDTIIIMTPILKVLTNKFVLLDNQTGFKNPIEEAKTSIFSLLTVS